MATSSGNNPDKSDLRGTGKRVIEVKQDFDACYLMAKNTNNPKDKGLVYVAPNKLKKFKEKYPDCTISRKPLK